VEDGGADQWGTRRSVSAKAVVSGLAFDAQTVPDPAREITSRSGSAAGCRPPATIAAKVTMLRLVTS
jgi:hypothetical protein